MSTTLRQYGVADRFLSWKTLLLSYKAYRVEVFLQFCSRSVSSVGQNRRGGSLRVVSEAVEASPVGTKPPAAADERISMDGRHDSNAAAPHSTTLSSLQGRAGGSAFTPNLVELVVRPGSTRRAEKQSPRIACTAVAAPSVRSRVLVSACPSASVARRGCRAPCSRHIKFWSIFSEISFSILSHRTRAYFIIRYTSSVMGWPDPSSCRGTGSLPSGTALLAFRSTIGSLDASVLMQPTPGGRSQEL